MKTSIALTTEIHNGLAAHLLREKFQEDLCFALWYPSEGEKRFTALVRDIILPLPGERKLHGNVSFTSQYFERAVGLARARSAGLILLHSHLGPGWQDMSDDDICAENKYAPAVYGATGLPFVGMTLGTDEAWSGRLWQKIGRREYGKQWCESVRVIGQRMRVTYDDRQIQIPKFSEALTRTVSVWGKNEQEHLARLKIGIIGAGSVGCLIAESLARMGIVQMKLLDFDRVEFLNLDRLLHATVKDAKKKRLKVEMLGDALIDSATARDFSVQALPFSICEEEGFRSALDCDVVFSCVDRPWARSVLNFIAYAHLIPVVDGGIRAEQMKTGKGIRRVNMRSHIVAPSRQCLECMGQYDPGLVSVERAGFLDDPSYIARLDKAHVFKQNENVFTFGMSTASFELLQFLRMVVNSPGLANLGADYYDFVTGSFSSKNEKCSPECPFSLLVAKGDRTGVSLTGEHIQAKKSRNLFEN
jgi:molybdopterin/thiamine biosynthesis adenylyltransferase